MNKYNVISNDFIHGFGFEIGCFNHIHNNVSVGKNVRIRSYVEIRPHTIIGDNVYIDSGVKMSGKCFIRDNVIIRYNSIIARNVTIHSDVFISPQVMFINIPVGGKTEKKKTVIHRNVFLGTNCTVHDGVEICEGCIIGAKSNVRKDILEKGTYVGGIDSDIKRIK